MKKNLGQVDRVARLFIGAVILIVAIQFQSWWGLLGLALIINGAIGFCSVYRLFGISTCSVEKPKQSSEGQGQQLPNIDMK